MNENFNVEICNIFKLAEEERKMLHHPYVGSEHLLLALLKEKDNISKICEENNLTYNIFKQELIRLVGICKKQTSINLYTPLLKRVISSSMNDNNPSTITKEKLLLAIIDEGEGVAIRILLGLDIDMEKIYEEISQSFKSKNKNKQLKYGKDLNELVNMEEEVIGREKELDFIVETLLRKKKNNPILIGDAGVGKTAIVEQLARNINNKCVPDELKESRIVMLEMGSVVANTKYRGEFEDKLNKVIKSLKENDILFIDEIHCMVNAGGADGAISAKDILKPYLARDNIKLIGATTTSEYNKYILPDKALVRRFETINITEPDKEETKKILYKVKKEYEHHHKLKISKNNIELIVNLTSEYLPNLKNPDKSLDFLDSVCSYTRLKKSKEHDSKKYEERIYKINEDIKKFLTNKDYKKALELKKEEFKIKNQVENCITTISKSDIYKVLESKCHTCLYLNREEVKKKLNENLDKVLGQEKVIETLKNKISENLSVKQHLLTCLLKGPSGVGKNFCVKQITKSFPKTTKFIKLDCKDYQNYNDIYKLIGLPNQQANYLFSQLKNQSLFIIQINNIDFATEEIKNLIQKIINEESITDNYDNLINFKNAYLFLTKTTGNIQMGFDKKETYLDELENIDLKVEFGSLKKETIKSILIQNKIDFQEEDLIYYSKNGLKNINKKIFVK